MTTPEQERQVLRQYFYDAWHKLNKGEPLSTLEQQLADIIIQHPEYHHILDDDDNRDKDYTPEQNSTNPFFHMALHASIMDQITTDRPPGILAIYGELASKTDDSHRAEHQMMEVLGEMLWQAQRSGQAPSEQLYLAALKKLLN